MGVVGSWCRLEARNRWRSLAWLAVLVAFAGATVMTAVAGARRGSTAVDRLEEGTLPATIVVLPNEPGFDWEPIRRLPGVAALSTFAVADYGIEEIPPDEFPEGLGFPPGDDEIFRTIERPIVLDGRVPDPARADEVVVSPKFRRHFGLGVGDSVTLRLFDPEAVDRNIAEGGELSDPDGPAVKATIVGVIRSPWYADTVQLSSGGLVPSPGLFAKYPTAFIGSSRMGFVNAMVRLEGGPAGINAFKERLAQATGRDNIDVWDQSEGADHARDVTGFEATCLLAFALAAALASVFLVGQAIARYAAVTATDLEIFRAMGVVPATTRLLATAGPTAAGAVGAVCAVAAAIVASRWFPLGTAANYEPHPGVDVDWLVLGAGVVVLPLVVAAGSVVSASSVRRVRTRGGLPVPLAKALAGAPVPVAVGARLTTSAGGRQAVPLRPALFGAVVGVAGVLAALTFAVGVGDATKDFSRFGQTYELAAFLGSNGQDFGPADRLLPAVAGDPGVAGIDDARVDIAQVGGGAASLYTFDPVGEPIEVVLTSGRMPTAAGNEVALGPRTAEALGIGVGATVELAGPKGTVPATVSGLAFVPAGPHNDYASGGWVAPRVYERLFDGHTFHFALVDLKEGVDPEVVAARLAESPGLDFAIGPISEPVEQAELRQVRSMPFVLAGFLTLLAVGAVGHTLASTVRRRRHDLAVLRVLGLTGRGVRLAIVTQATGIAVVGFVIGLPLGVALGRTVWGAVADSTPIVNLAPTAWLAVILTPVVAVVAANLLAAWPARRAASLRVSHVLRAD